eukprot:TRINITY_DN59450_c0_g1_i1.p1 TRINITY_DN59450_c0_g1~~TRINITY_DN59450_c0_g1_i1.p1  ORF type:complete len:1392 (+),score=150.26 TRINITY_DN59450_c0_g1_i1:28-4203(+)
MDTSFITRLQELALSDTPQDISIFEAECRAAMPRIIGAMEEYPQDLHLYTQCVCILKEYCWESDTRAVFLSHTNAIELTLQGLRTHGDDINFVVHAFGFFVNMSIVDTNRTVIAQRGGVITVLSTMKQFRSQTDVQKMGCMVLRNVSCDNAGNQRNIAAAGGVNILLDCLEMHTANFDVLEQAVTALLHVSLQDEATSCLAYEGGITILLNILRTQLSPVLLEEVCSILVNVSLNRDARRLLVSEGGTEAVIERLQLCSVNSLVASRCIQTLGNLACVDDLRLQVYSRGGLQTVMGVMVNENSGSKTMRHCMWAILNIITNNTEAQQWITTEVDGVDIVINAMQQFHDAVPVLVHACRVLWTLCYSNSDCQLQAARDGMPLVLNGMAQHLDNAELLAQFTSLVVNLTLNDATHKSFHMEDGISAVVDVMKAHPQNSTIFGKCCRILVNVAVTEETQDELMDLDIVTLLLAGVEHSPEDGDLIMKAGKLLTTLTAKHGYDIQGKVADQGGIGVIVSAAKINIEDPELLKYLISVMLNVSMADSSHQAIRTDGGIELLITTMNTYFDIPDLVSRCCRTLGNLIGGESGSEILSMADVRILVKVMETHLEDADIEVLCCWMLDELSNKESKLEGIFHSGGLEAAIATIRQHPTDTRVVKHALEVVVNFSCSLAPQHRYLIPESCVPLVIEQLKVMPTDVKELCCIILGNMAPRDRDLLLQNNVVDLVVQTLNDNPSAEELQVEGWSCLSKIAAVVEDWSLIDKVGGIGALIKLQATHPHSPNVQIACARAFRAVASLPSSASTLISAGGIPALLQCFLNSVDPIVQEHILLALALVAHHGTASELSNGGMDRQLISLTNNLLMNSVDGKMLSTTCLVAAGLAEKPELQASLVHNNVWHNLLNCIERCARIPDISVYDYNSLRMMCGYAMSAIVLHNETVRRDVLRYEDVADFVWFSARELQEAVDVQQEFSLDKLHMDVCAKVLEMMNTLELDASQVLPRGAPKPWQLPDQNVWEGPQDPVMLQQLSLEEREKHRQQQRSYEQIWAEQAKAATEERKGARRAESARNMQQYHNAPAIPEGTQEDEVFDLWKKMGITQQEVNSTIPNQVNEALAKHRADKAEELYEQMFRNTMERPTSSQAFITDNSTKRQLGLQAKPQDPLEQARIFRRERAMWEEQEEWERAQTVETEAEGRRRIEVRIATLLRSVYTRQQVETATTTSFLTSSDSKIHAGQSARKELNTGSQWLNSVLASSTGQGQAQGNNATHPRQLQFPPKPNREQEVPSNVQRGSSPNSGDNRRNSKSKLAGYHGSEMTAAYSAAEQGGTAAGGQLQEEGGGVLARVGSGGRPKAASMPGYIYYKEDPTASPGNRESKTPPTMTDTFLSVAVPSGLPPY